MDEESQNIEEKELDNGEEMNDEPGESEKLSGNNFFEENQFLIQVGIGLAGLAVLIVLFVGIFGGVSFGTILWRLFVSAFLFFALGMGIGYLVKTFVPELTKINEMSYDSEDLGENVDFVAGDEDADDKEYIDSIPLEEQVDQNRVQKEGVIGVDIGGKKFDLPDDPKMLADAVKTIYHKDE